MGKQSNSARRLLLILSAIKESDKRKSGQEILSKLFPDLARKTSSVRVYAEIIDLAANVKKDISSNMETESYMRNAEEVLAAFAAYPVTALIGQLQAAIKDVSIRGLEMFADYLDKHRPEKILSESDLERLRSAVKGLMDEVVNSDIDARLKQFMLDKLDNIEQAIILYEFHGTSPIEDSLQEAVGGIVLKENFDKQDASFKSDVWDKFKKYLGVALLTIKAVNATDTLIENVSDATNWVIEASSDFSVPNPKLSASDVDVE